MTRAPSGTHRRRVLRAAFTPWVVVGLGAALAGSVQVPGHSVLANGTAAAAPGGTSPTAQTAPTFPTVPPVTVPGGPAVAGTPVVRGPASVSPPHASPLVATTVQPIPQAALTAYQSAAVVIDTADPTCHLDWALLAGIGQIESDHGQVGGSSLDAAGVAHPSIIGPRLDGRQSTSVVRDTDAGRLDGDPRFDHAVGPMQFLPSTWAVVAVDGDNDGTRNVEDIDDAALGSAVYLCAGDGDLSTGPGSRAAVLRYNHSQAYADKVLAVAAALRHTSVLTSVSIQPVSTRLTALPALPHQPVAPPSEPAPGSAPTRPHASPPPSTPTPPAPPTTPTPPTKPPPTTRPTDPPTSPPTDPPSDPPSDPPTKPTDPPSDPPPSDPPADPPVIPDPVPAALAALTTDEIKAIDTAWPVCLAGLPDGWTAADMQGCLVEQLAVPADDPGLTAFLEWAVQTGLVPATDPPPGGP
jgi:hypothetical protein